MFSKTIRYLPRASSPAIPLASLFLVLTGFFGCKPFTGQSQKTRVEARVDQGHKAAKISPFLTQDTSFDQKTIFIATTRKGLEGFNRDLDELSLRLRNASLQVRTGARPGISKQREQAARLSKLLEEADGATIETWADIKTESTRTFVSLTEGVAQSRSWMDENEGAGK
ncbi:MAG: hypothetical protein QM790_00905 [Nibricoccus sp.]